jgi:hypothetical protein
MRPADVFSPSRVARAIAPRECLIEITRASHSSSLAPVVMRAAIANTRCARPICPEKKFSAGAESARPDAPFAQNCATFATHKRIARVGSRRARWKFRGIFRVIAGRKIVAVDRQCSSLSINSA